MTVTHLADNEYEQIFNPYNAFNSVPFNRYTSAIKGYELRLLGFKTSKYKLGLIGGIINNRLHTPFSAPFGGFSFVKSDIELSVIDEAVSALIEYCNNTQLNGLEITLPPTFYNNSFIAKLNSSFYRNKFMLSNKNLNYAIELPASMDDYHNSLHYNAKKNLTKALSQSFEFSKCVTDDEIEACYKTIQTNRQQRGFPLHMSLQQILDTSQFIKVDFFTVDTPQQAVAAAIIFHVSPSIIQVVYWGDLVEFANMRSMNYLSYNIVKYYLDTDIKFIDIGPSTDNSMPNYGLCDFKESIGCDVTEKNSWSYNVSR